MGTIKASALGRTLSSGPVNPETIITNFMGPTTERRLHARDLLQGLIYAHEFEVQRSNNYPRSPIDQ